MSEKQSTVNTTVKGSLTPTLEHHVDKSDFRQKFGVSTYLKGSFLIITIMLLFQNSAGLGLADFYF